jgi:hypothetical protein
MVREPWGIQGCRVLSLPIGRPWLSLEAEVTQRVVTLGCQDGAVVGEPSLSTIGFAIIELLIWIR